MTDALMRRMRLMARGREVDVELNANADQFLCEMIINK